jgi:hypothetical protein
MPNIKFDTNSYLNLYEDGSYDLRLGDTSIVQCFPGLNGSRLSGARVQVEGDLHAATASYKTPDFTLVLSWTAREGYLSLKPELRDIKLDAVEKLSVLQDAYVSGAEKVLAHGYFSWDQSFLLDAEELDTAEGNGVTAIMGASEVGLAGYLVHDLLFQTFNFRSEQNQIRLSAESYLEGKDLASISQFNFPEMVFMSQSDLDAGQKKWADLCVQASSMKACKPTTKGWCSWYYDYFWFSGDILESHLKNFAPFKAELDLDVFVIDANHFEHLGDWLEPDPKFYKGLEYYAGQIKEAGYIPGVWIGPWMVADRSRLYREHPEWLCRDEQNELIEFMNPLGEDNVWGYRSKIHYCLDTSHPEAFEYLRQVFGTLRKWGFRYFKTDFMFWGSMDRFEGGWYHEGLNAHNLILNKADRPLIKRHTPGKTRMEYFVDVLKMIREEIGQESIWLGCGQPIWASAGYVDCMRVSRDVGARWVAHNSPKELLNDLALRNFTNGRFYEVDPDCVLLRNFETKISETEATSLALYMGVAQGMILTSDYIHKCPAHRLEIFKFIQGDNTAVDFKPQLLGRQTDLIIYSGVNQKTGINILFFFNNGEELVEKTYALEQLGVRGSIAVEWRKEEDSFSVDQEISVSLDAHAATLIYLQDHAFDQGWKPACITG